MDNELETLDDYDFGTLVIDQAINQDEKLLSQDSLKEEIFNSRVGQGLDSVLGIPKNNIFTPIFGELSFQEYGDEEDAFKFDLASSHQEFTKTTAMSAKGKASFGIGKIKASVSANTFFSSNSYSCYLIGHLRKTSKGYGTKSIAILPEILNYIKKNEPDHLKVERQLGDKVITGFNLAAEITIIAEFQTNSEQMKNEMAGKLTASMSKGSGSVAFAQAISEIKNSTKKTIAVIGHIPDSKVDFTSEAELIGLLNSFNTEYLNKLRISNYITQDYKTLNELIDLPFTDNENLRVRNKFAAHLNSLYQNYYEWFTDISYVIDLNKISEFDTTVIDKARTDYKTCLNGLAEIEKLDDDSLTAWEKDSNWKSFFDISRLNHFLSEFPIYKQKGAVVTATPQTTPRRKPEQISITRENNARGGGI